MNLTNKDVILSYIMTTAKYNFSVYEKRILYRIIEHLQPELFGVKLDKNFKINPNLWGDYNVTFSISSILANDEDHNYERVKIALRALAKKEIGIFDDGVKWRPLYILAVPEIELRSSTFTFLLQKQVHEAIFNFSKGHRKIELETAMQFESVYAMRFYELVSNQKAPIRFSIEQLKIMFDLVTKYKLTADFIRYVIDPAKEELDKCSPFTFTYERLKSGKKVTAIEITPKSQPKFRDEATETHELKKKISLSSLMPHHLRVYLKENFLFSDNELKNNLDLIKNAGECGDLLKALSDMKRKATEAKNPQGYVINAMKKMVEKRATEKYGDLLK